MQQLLCSRWDTEVVQEELSPYPVGCQMAAELDSIRSVLSGTDARRGHSDVGIDESCCTSQPARKAQSWLRCMAHTRKESRWTSRISYA